MFELTKSRGVIKAHDLFNFGHGMCMILAMYALLSCRFS